MADTDLNQRLVKATKNELLQIVQSLIRSSKDTNDHALRLLNYIDGQKAPVAAPSKSKRRSSRTSTRASSEASQDSGVQVHPLLQNALKNSELKLEICERCTEPFEEKHNTSRSCSYHDGQWLIEVEGKGSIVFTPASTASQETLESDGDWIKSCCSAPKEDLGRGCVRAKHVAMSAKYSGDAQH
ncbi:hypothetical protein CkaCkLH20_03062 [Colletotrichum karsti]|uniref:Uncharacterized protein n=1 Tax=Colletotrichum karsti TaxID=1095194 RepID=A0A9P6IBM4_9PEZI|nr:uncharacterized protein CkaCkLH20_03062 [Colletotrichum karsti]KAF9879519.1 hypothetical protein CkaCkLH20_03062 [Colletotrichum karsti]